MTTAGKDGRRTLDGLAIAAVGALALATALGFLGSRHPLLDLLACFRTQYAVLALPFVAYLLWRRRRMGALLALAVLVVNGGLAALPRVRSAPRVGSPAETLRLLRINLAARAGPEVEAYVRDARPDVVVASFAGGSWAERIRALPGGPWHEIHTRDGATILSRFPLSHAGRTHGADPIVADLPDGPLTLLGVHTVQPFGAGGWNRNAAQLEAVARAVGRNPTRTIVAGDLNATPWSHAFRRLLAETGLVDSRDGAGLQPTWPSSAPIGLLRIPIDHVLVSPDLGVAERSVGPDVADPHRPVLVVIEIP